jgi:hypothetical protein
MQPAIVRSAAGTLMLLVTSRASVICVRVTKNRSAEAYYWLQQYYWEGDMCRAL